LHVLLHADRAPLSSCDAGTRDSGARVARAAPHEGATRELRRSGGDLLAYGRRALDGHFRCTLSHEVDMIAYLRTPLSLVWLLLVAVTFVSWRVGAGGDRGEAGVSLAVTAVVVAMALVKTRFVFRYFMEVRTGPSWLRATCDAWLAGIAFVFV